MVGVLLDGDASGAEIGPMAVSVACPCRGMRML